MMDSPARWRVYLCCGPDCTARRSPALLRQLEREVADAGLDDAVEVLPSGCMKHCERGPSLVLRPGPVYYERIDPGRLQRIVRQHLGTGRAIPEWFYQGDDAGLPDGGRPSAPSPYGPPPEEHPAASRYGPPRARPVASRYGPPPEERPGASPYGPPTAERPAPPRPKRRPHSVDVDDFKW